MRKDPSQRRDEDEAERLANPGMPGGTKPGADKFDYMYPDNTKKRAVERGKEKRRKGRDEADSLEGIGSSRDYTRSTNRKKESKGLLHSFSYVTMMFGLFFLAMAIYHWVQTPPEAWNWEHTRFTIVLFIYVLSMALIQWRLRRSNGDSYDPEMQ